MSHLPQFYNTGMNNAAEFAASGWPYAQRVSGSTVVRFPWVTNEIYVINDSGGTVRVAFTAPGLTGSNYIPVINNTAPTFRVKVAELHVSGAAAFTVAAALTNIVPTQYPRLSQSAYVVHDLEDETLTKKYPGV